MAWNEAVITDKGVALLAKTFTEGNIVLTRAVGGEGYTAPERLTETTDVQPPVHEMGLAGVSAEQGKITVRVRGQNTNLAARYTLRQIGIFAKEKGSAGEDILFAVIQDEAGEVIPSVAENPEFLIEFDFVIPVSNAENIEVVLSSVLFALQADVERMIKRMDIVIPHENWNVLKEDALYKDIPIENITGDMTPIVSIAPDFLTAAKACGMSTACESFDGKLRVYAQKSPTEDIHGSLLLVGEYSA